MANVLDALKRFRDSSVHQSHTEAATPAHLLGLTLEEFSREDDVLLIRSLLLKDDIYLVSNSRCLTGLPSDHAAYLPEEMRVLYALPPDLIVAAHQLKKKLDGVVVGYGEPNGQIFRP